MAHMHRLERLWLWRFAKRHVRKADNSLFTLALLVNLVMLWRSQLCLDHDGSGRRNAWSDDFCSLSAQRAVWAFANDGRFFDLKSEAPAYLAEPQREEDLVRGYFRVEGNNATRPAQFDHDLAMVLQVLVFVFGSGKLDVGF